MLLVGLAGAGGCTVLFPFAQPEDELPGPACDPRPPEATTWPDENGREDEPWRSTDPPVRGVPFLDVAFGATTIVRVTDSGRAHHPEPSLPSFNADSTRFLVYEARPAGGPRTPFVYTLDDTAGGPLIGDGDPASIGECLDRELWWSATDPAILYCMAVAGHARVLALDPSDGRVTAEWRLDAVLPDEDDDVLGFLSVSQDGRAALRKNVSFEVLVVPLDEAHTEATVYPYGGLVDPIPKLDHSGRWLIVESDGRREVRDLRDPDGQVAAVSGDGFGSAPGAGVLYEPAGERVLARDLSATQSTRSFFDYTRGLQPSLTAPRGDPDWVLLSLCKPVPDDDPTPYDGEVLAVATDGSWARRLAQMHSACGDEFFGGGRASVSHDGRYALFTHENQQGDSDVYLLALPCE